MAIFGTAIFSLTNLAVVCLAETPVGEIPKSLRGLRKEIEFLPNTPSTQVKTVVTESTYNMGDKETPLIAEARALAQIKRAALEQMGIYVQSYTRVRDSDITTDEIKAVTAGFMEVEVLEKKRTLVRAGIQVHVKARCTIQLDHAEASLRRLGETGQIHRNTLAERQQRLQQEHAQLVQEVENLKNHLVHSRPDTRDQLASDLATRQRHLEARDLRGKASQVPERETSRLNFFLRLLLSILSTVRHGMSEG
jgi:hypothetical protein